MSYLTARPADELLAAAWQNATCQWWDRSRGSYELVTSSLVLEEARRGHPDAVNRRLEALKGIPNLRLYDEITRLAELLVSAGALPQKATDDAMHVAFAAYHNITSIICLLGIVDILTMLQRNLLFAKHVRNMDSSALKSAHRLN